MKFTKMQGTGNDFIVVDNRKGNSSADFSLHARKYCDRHFGVGADGILVIGTADTADATMAVFNADGSEAEMCGNGIRCVAKYLIDSGHSSDVARIETRAGVKTVRAVSDGYEVNMGAAQVLDASEVSVPLGNFSYVPVDMGNPHTVIFVDSIPENWKEIGRQIEKAKQFPNRTNVEFAVVESSERITLSVWERGAGATMACGTGACASLAAAVAAGKISGKTVVALPGGELTIELRDGSVFMTGPAETVFEGTITI